MYLPKVCVQKRTFEISREQDQKSSMIHLASPHLFALLIHEACSDHYFHMTVVFVRLPAVPTFQNLAKQNKFQVRIMIATGGTVSLAEWIIHDTHVGRPCGSKIGLVQLSINQAIQFSYKCIALLLVWWLMHFPVLQTSIPWALTFCRGFSSHSFFFFYYPVSSHYPPNRKLRYTEEAKHDAIETTKGLECVNKIF